MKALSSRQRIEIYEAHAILNVFDDLSGFPFTANKFIDRKRTRIINLTEKEYIPQLIRNELTKLIAKEK